MREVTNYTDKSAFDNFFVDTYQLLKRQIWNIEIVVSIVKANDATTSPCIIDVFLFSGCQSQTKKKILKVEYIKQYDYRIAIDVWNGLWGGETKYILDNSRINFHDSADQT